MRSFLLAVFLWGVCSWMSAQERSATEAEQIALQFALSQQHAASGSRSESGRNLSIDVDRTHTTAGCFLLNVGNHQGWVVVSKNKNAYPVLAYSVEGQLSNDNMPDNMRAWLEEYDRQQSWMAKQDDLDANNDTPATYDWPDIAPLLSTQWGQGAPYNLLLPMVAEETKLQEEYSWVPAVTGNHCTACCQIMNYYQWPKTTLKPIEYANEGTQYFSFPLEELPVTDFEWDKMQDTYDETDVGENAQAVAKLMRYVGQAIPTGYHCVNGRVYGQGVFRKEMFTDYFGYADSCTTYSRSNSGHVMKKDVGQHQWEELSWDETAWDRLIYDELANGRPVLFEGLSDVNTDDPNITRMTHAFVCDGYKDGGFFHFNWGWNGLCDGYFRSSSFALNRNGVDYDFSLKQTVHLGIHPASSDVAGIDDVTREGTYSKHQIFDLQGRRLNALPRRGLYIRNGRKVVVR